METHLSRFAGQTTGVCDNKICCTYIKKAKGVVNTQDPSAHEMCLLYYNRKAKRVQDLAHVCYTYPNTPPQTKISPNSFMKCLTLGDGSALVSMSATIMIVGVHGKWNWFDIIKSIALEDRVNIRALGKQKEMTFIDMADFDSENLVELT